MRGVKVQGWGGFELKSVPRWPTSQPGEAVERNKTHTKPIRVQTRAATNAITIHTCIRTERTGHGSFSQAALHEHEYTHVNRTLLSALEGPPLAGKKQPKRGAGAPSPN